MRWRVSAAASARAFCSYARVTFCEPYRLSVDRLSCECNTAAQSQDSLSDESENGMVPQEIDVLVVGAGPAGLTAAAALRRYGVEVLVLERKARLSVHPRATVVSTRSMELLRSWGLEDEIRAGGIPDVEWLGLVTETLASADRGKPVTLGLPTKEQAGVLSPTAPLCVPQDHTEAVLLGYARSLGAKVEFGRE